MREEIVLYLASLILQVMCVFSSIIKRRHCEFTVRAGPTNLVCCFMPLSFKTYNSGNQTITNKLAFHSNETSKVKLSII